MRSKVTKSVLGIVVATFIIALTSVTSAFAADKTLNMPEASDLLEKASEMRAITTIVNKCVPDDVTMHAYNHAGVFTDAVHDTGPWLEKYFLGEWSDGKIRCNEKDSAVLTKFASAIGHSVSDLLCNAENHEYPGLINMVSYNNSKWTAYKTNCDRFGVDGGAYSEYFKSSNFSGGASYEYKGKSYDNGDEYLRQLYNDWVNNKSGNPYIPGYYSSTQSQLGFAKYFIYQKDYFTQCGNNKVNDGNNGPGDLGIKIISKKGVVTTVYYEPQSEKTAGATIEGEMNPSCENFKNRINDNYKAYRQKLAEIYKNECNKAATEVWKFMYLQAKAITNSSAEPQVVTPEGAYPADNWEAQKSKISQEKLKSWEKQGLVWKNYSETNDEDGNPVKKVTEFNGEVVTDAKQTITDYESYGGNYFIDKGEDEGFECKAPKEYSIKTNPVDDESSDTSGEAEETCQNSGGAGSLGWIVCPILDWMQQASEKVYTEYVEPNLVLETGLFEGDDGTKKAWDIFQSFANICFIILFLAIIFSQLTGVGIDNYGIKKLLPKLIVVAILVNISYLICVICADLSNILGNGLKTMFDGLSVGNSVTVGNASFGDGAGATAITAVALVAAVFALGAAVWSNPAILLTLLVSALGVLIAIFFLFVLLAARKAAIVVLTAISPLAFVCYMLPNTKKLFDRWLKLWEAMLLLYPICGLLVGGGDFVSRLMLTVLSSGKGNTNNDFFGYFTAMIIGIIPIFFIPTVLKSSFAAIGTIGSKITGFGKTAQGWATGKMRNSEGYKNAQKMGLDRKVRKQAGLDKQGDPTRLGRVKNRFARTGLGRFIGSDTRLAAKTAATKKNIATQEEAGATLMQTLAAADMADAPDIIGADGNSLFKGKRESYYGGEFLKAAKSGDRKRMNAALAAAKSAGVKDGDIAKMVRHAENSGALESLGDTKARWLQSQAASNNAFAKDVELQHWASRGGVDSRGGRLTLGDYGDYARGTDGTGKRNMDATDLDKSKISSASAESLAGLIKAGDLIGAGLAEQALSDASANLSPEKSIMLGAVKEKSEGKLTITVTHSAKDLKDDAVSLSGGGTATHGTINASSNDVERWTAPPAERVTVDQQKPNEVPVNIAGNVTGEITIHHEHHNNPNPNPNNGGETFEGGSGI